MKEVLRRIKPRLADDHPGYFQVVLGVVLVHLALGVDVTLPNRHSGVVFTYLRPFTELFAILHFAIAAVIIVALYLPQERWRIARWACVASVFVFNSAALLVFAAAVVYPVVSFQLTFLYVAISLSSIAAAREPLHQPLQRERAI